MPLLYRHWPHHLDMYIEEKIYEILKACHDGIRGGHFSDKTTGYKLPHQRYYWPTIFKYYKEYVKRCDNYQHMVIPMQSNEMPLQPQLVLELFERRAIQLIGPINPPSHHNSYIIVCTIYVTKWMEDEALPATTEKTATNFLHE